MIIASHVWMLNVAQGHGQSARFSEMLDACRQIIDNHHDNADALLDVGVLLFNFGYVSRARQCFERVRQIAPTDLRPVVNLANLERDVGNHSESRRLYAALLAQLPNNPVIRRNMLTSLEYDPAVSDTERLAHARSWGEWAMSQSGSSHFRPAIYLLDGRPLRVGYVSADICQHTVGLFVKVVLQSHDPERVTAFVYSAGKVKDWVTDEIRATCQFRDVATLDDAALAAMIRQDGIDVLVDLSGHTGGSRLTVFSHRPAPVQVSWLGYFATTGLNCIDAVLLDEWHAPSGAEAQFVEPVIRLANGRFCYQPVQWASDEVASLPCLKVGKVTFGCFNNTAKLNDDVFDVWAKILATVPESRLVLKWRTFIDDELCRSVRNSFALRGVAPERIELRGASFHVDVLKEYADIDIALDPFPFTGGLTSCEALWMGVPVVTWPRNRVVSRQTFAFLSAMGLAELAAHDAESYIGIAVDLAKDKHRLNTLRNEMRTRMQASPLMDAQGFTCQFEQCLIDLYQDICKSEKAIVRSYKTILHVGPGHRNGGAKLPAAFQVSEWKELRLDIDPVNEPDIIGSMLDMAEVASASVDAIYSAHNIQYVYAHEVLVVLKEFMRVLKPDGFLVITCPDLQTVCALVAEDKLTDPVYSSQAGAITPLDILYGHGAALAADQLYMAHKCGFTLKTLTTALQSAGFMTIAGKRRFKGFDLWAVASKEAIGEAEIRELAERVLPA
ncbi:MAG: O-linked N-acetylglucosamine transferase family protein [Methylobacter sp.]